MSKANRSGISLDEKDAAIVKGMLARGDRQHDIAAWFGVNGGRVADISTGKTFDHVAAVHEGLPKPGPYLSGRSGNDAKETIELVIEELLEMAQRLETRLKDI
ncbi:hypothetical protein ACVDG9_23785 [Roseibium sp. RP-7]